MFHLLLRFVGWGALACSSTSLLYGRFEMIRLFSRRGLQSDFGYEWNIVVAMTADFPALIVSLLFLLLSRLLLGRWVRRVLDINLGIILVAILQYSAAYSSMLNLEACGMSLCEGERLIYWFWHLISPNSM